MKHWTEFRTAFYVADTGSVSAAAKALGIHRATVLRHLEALEKELGTKVFLRDKQGYRLTEVGDDLLRVARLTEEQLQGFSRRTKGQEGEIEGEFILTALDTMATLLVPAIAQFRSRYPKVITRCLTGTELVKLEYGQAHLAIRSGPKPQDESYVVLPFFPVKVGLYASEDYLKQFGIPLSDKNLSVHQFVYIDDDRQRLDIQRWFAETVTPEQIACSSNNREVLERAVVDGVGIGFLAQHEAARFPHLRQVLPSISLEAPSWIVTHGDLHRSEKVQAFLEVLKSENYKQEIQAILQRQAPMARISEY